MNSARPLPPDEATVAAYLGNQLPEPQAEAFELYCLDHPDFAQKVELDLTMKRGLREIGIRDLQSRPTVRFRPLRAMAAGLGAAAGCILLIWAWSHWQVGLIAYGNQNKIPLELRAGVPIGVTLLRLRGADATHRVVVPRRSGVLELKIFPDNSPGRQGYSVGIAVDSIVGSRSVVLDQLRPDADGFLELYLPLLNVVGHTLNITVASDADHSATQASAFQLQVVAGTD
jgi:hypothetical protein